MKTSNDSNVPPPIGPAAAARLFVLGLLWSVAAAGAPRSPLPPLPEVGVSWSESFDEPYRLGTNVALPSDFAESFSGYCLDRTFSPVRPWIIPMATTNKLAVDPQRGAIRFFYRPMFDVSGPGQPATLFSVVTPDGSTSLLWYSLVVSADGSSIQLLGSDWSTPCLSAPVGFSAGDWHVVTLAYSDTNSILFLDSDAIAQGGGVPTISAAMVTNTVLVVGSTLDGLNVAAGQIDLWTDFSGNNRIQQARGFPFGIDFQRGVAKYASNRLPIAALGPTTPEEQLARRSAMASSTVVINPPWPPLGGGGVTNWTNTSSQAVVYTTNDLWIELTSITNATGCFVLHPPSAETQTGVFDLFMTTNLTANVPGLNLTNWLWILRTCPGETNLFVAGLTGDLAFFMLGRTNDADADGMSDAYERLVNHTDPSSPDALVILSQPVSQTVWAEEDVAFSVVVQNGQSLSYQWMLNGTPLAGETNFSLTLLAAMPEQGGDYSVLVSSLGGPSVLSSNATLTVQWGNYPEGGLFTTLAGARRDFTFESGSTYFVMAPLQLLWPYDDPGRQRDQVRHLAERHDPNLGHAGHRRKALLSGNPHMR